MGRPRTISILEENFPTIKFSCGADETGHLIIETLLVPRFVMSPRGRILKLETYCHKRVQRNGSSRSAQSRDFGAGCRLVLVPARPFR